MLHHHSGDCVQVTANLFSDRLEKVEDASGVWTAFTTYITKVCSLTQSCTMEVQKERKCIWCPCELYWYVFVSVNTKLRCVFFENGFVRLPHICFPPKVWPKAPMKLFTNYHCDWLATILDLPLLYQCDITLRRSSKWLIRVMLFHHNSNLVKESIISDKIHPRVDNFFFSITSSLGVPIVHMMDFFRLLEPFLKTSVVFLYKKNCG